MGIKKGDTCVSRLNLAKVSSVNFSEHIRINYIKVHVQCEVLRQMKLGGTSFIRYKEEVQKKAPLRRTSEDCEYVWFIAQHLCLNDICS
jgi:hypothetical protein